MPKRWQMFVPCSGGKKKKKEGKKCDPVFFFFTPLSFLLLLLLLSLPPKTNLVVRWKNRTTYISFFYFDLYQNEKGERRSLNFLPKNKNVPPSHTHTHERGERESKGRRVVSVERPPYAEVSLF